MKKKIEEKSVNTTEVYQAIGIAGGTILQTLEEINDRTPKLDKAYLDSDGDPDHEKICGENDLTAKDVYHYGVITGLKLAISEIQQTYNKLPKEVRDAVTDYAESKQPTKDDGSTKTVHVKVSSLEDKAEMIKELEKEILRDGDISKEMMNRILNKVKKEL